MTRVPADEQRLREIEQRAEAATEGPWAWFGNSSVHHVYLSTVNHGRRFVMGFRRWGMNAAQPMFRDAPGEDGVMYDAADLARYEVLGGQTIAEAGKEPYRYDIVGFDSPDAAFIANARADIPFLLALLRVREQEAATLREAHERCCDETDYCYVCDNHPSHGHAFDCLLAVLVADPAAEETGA